MHSDYYERKNRFIFYFGILQLSRSVRNAYRSKNVLRLICSESFQLQKEKKMKKINGRGTSSPRYAELGLLTSVVMMPSYND